MLNRTRHRSIRRSLRTRRRMRGGATTLPTTTWGAWSAYPGALAWSPTTQAPPPLANGGQYISPQSTGAWASHPMPATQYAFAMESSRIAGNPEVFFHQRPNDNNGASFSPYVGIPISPLHVAGMIPPYAQTQMGGKRRNRK